MTSPRSDAIAAPDGPVPTPDTSGEASDLLDKVELHLFNTVPESIGPFGASRLQWDVDAPERVTLELDRGRIPVRGQRLVTPERSQEFVLRARAFQHARVLGRVTVQVDLAACRTDPILDISHFIRNLLRSSIENDPDLYFRDTRKRPFGRPPVGPPPGPLLDFPDGRIRFELLLKARAEKKWLGIDWAPDPSVDIEASFMLRVSNGRIVSFAEDIDVDVRVPWYVWLVPGAIIALPVALGFGRQRAREGARGAIDAIVELINVLAVLEQGRRLHSVQIDAVAERADLELFHCPDDQLQNLVPRLDSVAMAPPPA